MENQDLGIEIDPNKFKRDISNKMDVRQLIYAYKFKNKMPVLKGSSSQSIYYYYGDYDFSCNLGLLNKYKPKILYEEFLKIFNRLYKLNDVYFIEFKIQYKNGDKKKFTKDDEITIKDFTNKFNDIDFLKIDNVIYSNNDFIESSCMYLFTNDENKMTTDEYVSNFLEDIKELKADGSYFKILKRLNSLFVALNIPLKYRDSLVNVLNSEYGKMYQDKTRLEAYELVKENYKDEITKQRLKLFESNIEGIPSRLIKQYGDKINKMAKKLIPKYEEVLKEHLK